MRSCFSNLNPISLLTYRNILEIVNLPFPIDFLSIVSRFAPTPVFPSSSEWAVTKHEGRAVF